MTLLTETARAKVNLTLRVLGRRPDGYHDLDSIVAFADCADRLTLEPGAELSLVTTGPRAGECGEGEDNLVIRVTRALGARVEGLGTGRFILDKHLPVAAGIGGGSADAAAALRLLARANGMAADDARLMDAAKATGSDIPVCIASHACVMGGVGEDLTPLSIPVLPCVMVNPRVAVPTKDVFAGLHLLAGELRVGVAEVLEAITLPKPGASQEEWVLQLIGGTNDLEAPALKIQPVIGEVLATLRDTEGVRLARMSGSGATCFAIYDTPAQAKAAGDSIARLQPGWWVHAGTLS
ncbi:MAG: 4-(cytidine 5'-diphospho)-2-C-methyl-D-erythritol kinase [Bradyrhizobiaceae bacterium]|nr:MAG: 4-(cytidine 5'-diphospho)-2-C-methyl-D-erythritol kinase [Bradyrhizobiaceae bacterium]